MSEQEKKLLKSILKQIVGSLLVDNGEMPLSQATKLFDKINDL